MRITHILSGDLWGGAESQVYYTLCRLVEVDDIKIEVILFNKGDLYDRLDKKNIKVYLLDESKYSDYVITKKMKRLVSETFPDILHVHDYKSHVLSVLSGISSRNKYKLVRTFHGQTISPASLKSSMIYLMQKMVLRFGTDCIITVSNDLENTFREKYKNTKIVMIHNAIEAYRLNRQNNAQLRSDYELGHETFWIATAARLVKIKNLDMLIDAADCLRKKTGKRFIVSIFGDGPLKDELNNKIKAKGLDKIVLMHGHCKNIIPVLQAIDVFALTSTNEGLPMSLLEAMSLGTVPVCTNVGGIPEVIEDGISGFLVESNSAEKLADVLLLLINNDDLMKQVGECALQKMRNQFSIEHANKKLVQLYASTVKSANNSNLTIQ